MAHVAPRIDVKTFVPWDRSGAATVGLSAVILSASAPFHQHILVHTNHTLAKVKSRKRGLESLYISFVMYFFYKIKIRFLPMTIVIPIPYRDVENKNSRL